MQEYINVQGKDKFRQLYEHGKLVYSYKNGQLHNEDGPAVVQGMNKEWWIDGVFQYKVTEESFIENVKALLDFLAQYPPHFEDGKSMETDLSGFVEEIEKAL